MVSGVSTTNFPLEGRYTKVVGNRNFWRRGLNQDVSLAIAFRVQQPPTVITNQTLVEPIIFLLLEVLQQPPSIVGFCRRFVSFEECNQAQAYFLFIDSTPRATNDPSKKILPGNSAISRLILQLCVCFFSE